MRLLLTLSVLAACGSSDSLPLISVEDAGDFCEVTGAAYCDGWIGCGLIASSDRNQCESLFFRGCCADDGLCGTPLNQSDEDTARCLGSIDDLSCQDLENLVVTPACGNPSVSELLSSAHF